MIKTLVGEREILLAGSMLALAVLVVLALVPARASAAVTNASLGGGNALARATAGQSQGLTHANTASNLLARLTFASTRGGKPDEVPPQGGESNTGGTEAEGTNGSEGAGGASNQNQGEGSGTNGGASAGNGGNGGDGGNASLGGLVRAGNVVSNANALNMLNVNIVRISSR